MVLFSVFEYFFLMEILVPAQMPFLLIIATMNDSSHFSDVFWLSEIVRALSLDVFCARRINLDNRLSL